MRNNIWNLVWGIIGLVIVVKFILNGMPGKAILGLEIKPWLYITIWAVISVLSLLSFFKRRKIELKNKK